MTQYTIVIHYMDKVTLYNMSLLCKHQRFTITADIQSYEAVFIYVKSCNQNQTMLPTKHMDLYHNSQNKNTIHLNQPKHRNKRVQHFR